MKKKCVAKRKLLAYRLDFNFRERRSGLYNSSYAIALTRMASLENGRQQKALLNNYSLFPFDYSLRIIKIVAEVAIAVINICKQFRSADTPIGI